MHKIIAVVTAAAFTTLSGSSASAFELETSTPSIEVATPSMAELLHESNFIQDGVLVRVAFTRDAEGVLGEATVFDPDTGDEVDVWSDGATLWWAGVAGGEPVSGSIPVLKLDADLAHASACFVPAIAIVCLGALAILFSGGGCAHFINCTPSGKDPCGSGICEPPSPVPMPGDGGGGDSSDDDGGDGDGDD
jgi:hypothetical protein